MSGKPKGPYTLWVDYGYEGWRFTDFATLKEAVEVEKHCSDWVVTKLAEYAVVDFEGEAVNTADLLAGAADEIERLRKIEADYVSYMAWRSGTLVYDKTPPVFLRIVNT